jgi:uncharacterized protein (TIGR03067 family)
VAVIALAAVVLMAAGNPRSERAQADVTTLQGTWKIVSLEAEGATADADQLQAPRLMIKGNAFVFSTERSEQRGTLAIDGSKKPKTIDLTFADGPDKGKTAHGIYKIEDDTLTLCLGEVGAERPRKFVTKPKTGHVLEVLKRGD